MKNKINELNNERNELQQHIGRIKYILSESFLSAKNSKELVEIVNQFEIKYDEYYQRSLLN